MLAGSVIKDRDASLVWQYVDDDGNVQGPFSKKDMLVWFSQGYIQPQIKLVGILGDAEGAAPPPLSSFKTLQELVAIYLRRERLYVPAFDLGKQT